MGQRHQVFLIVPNPVTNWKKSGISKELKAEFGTERTTVLAFHHQWLYGASAVTNCHNVLSWLEKNAQGPEYKNIVISNSYIDLDYQQLWINLMSIFREPIIKKYGRSYSCEHFIYLNKEEPVMRTNYTVGDNNDGITIIDCINRKYCFMNIFEQEKGNTSVSGLPQKTPSTAGDYFSAYYPDKPKEKNAIDKRFNQYNLLTIEEISTHFKN